MWFACGRSGASLTNDVLGDVVLGLGQQAVGQQKGEAMKQAPKVGKVSLVVAGSDGRQAWTWLSPSGKALNAMVFQQVNYQEGSHGRGMDILLLQSAPW